MSGKSRERDRDDVKPRLDKLLRLVRIPGMDDRPGDCRRIRALQVGTIDRVVRGRPTESSLIKDLLERQRGNAKEFYQLMAGLRLMAENEEIPFGANVKRCRGARGVIELRAGKRRLYCFVDPETQRLSSPQSLSR